MNVQILLFTLAVSLVTAFIFGLWPAIQGSKTQTRDALQAASKRSTAGASARRAQSVLVVAEVALSLVLLLMAGLMIRSFAKLTNIDPGMGTTNVMSMRMNRSPAKSGDGATNAIFFQQVADRVKTLPGIDAAGIVSHPPFGSTEEFPITVESAADAAAQTQSIDTRIVRAGYFNTMQIPLVGGQFFSIEDGPQSTPVVIVNQAMANRYWSNHDPLGKRLKIGAADYGNLRCDLVFGYPANAGDWDQDGAGRARRRRAATGVRAIHAVDSDWCSPRTRRGVCVNATDDEPVVRRNADGHHDIRSGFQSACHWWR